MIAMFLSQTGLSPWPFVSLLFAAIFIALLLNSIHTRRRLASMQILADELELEVTGRGSDLALAGQFEGLEVNIAYGVTPGTANHGSASHTVGRRPFTEIVVRTGTTLPAGLHVTRQGPFQSAVDAWAGIEQVLTGDQFQDECFHIISQDVDGAKHLLRNSSVGNAISRATDTYPELRLMDGCLPSPVEAIGSLFGKPVPKPQNSAGKICVDLSGHIETGVELRLHLGRIAALAHVLDSFLLNQRLQ